MVRAFPALWLLGALILGIGAGDRITAPPWLFPLCTIGLFALGLVSRRRWFGVALLLLATAAASASAYTLRYRPGGIRHIAGVIEAAPTATVFATVADWPDLRERRTDIPLAVDSLLIDRIMYRVDGGLLLTVTDTTTVLQRGDRIIVHGRLYPLSDTRRMGFDYRRFLQLRGLFGRMYLSTLLDVQIDRRSPIGPLAFVDRARAAILGVLDQSLTPESAALAKGLLLGETRGIAPHVYALFRDSGTLHLLAVSGSNVALVLLVFLAVIRPFRVPLLPRRLATLLLILGYALLCHLEPSVVRASIMAGLVILARLLHRKVDLNHIVAVAAVLILLWDPGQLFDVGCQLSFVTAWGLVFVVPRLTCLFERHHQRHWYRWLIFPLLISVTAQLVSMPLSIFYFQRLPILSVPANLLVVPMVTFCVVGVAAVLGAAALHPLLGLMIGSWVDPLHRLTVWLLEQMGGAQMPVIETGALVYSRFGWALVIVAYILILLLVLSIRRGRARRLLVQAALTIAVLAMSAAAVRPTVAAADQLLVHSIPGGLAAFRMVGEHEADLLLVSPAAGDYPLDSIVLAPLCTAHKIDSIHYLFLLEADFAVVPELWRLATALGADSVFVDRSRLARLRDVCRQSAAGPLGPQVHVLSPALRPDSGEGYVALEDGLLLLQRGRGYLFCPQVPSRIPPERQGLRSFALLAGRRWRLSPEARSVWLGCGISPIVAASIRRESAESYQAVTADQTEPATTCLIDLKRQGSIALNIRDNSWRGLY